MANGPLDLLYVLCRVTRVLGPFSPPSHHSFREEDKYVHQDKSPSVKMFSRCRVVDGYRGMWRSRYSRVGRLSDGLTLVSWSQTWL